jgi:hypothetical protein
LKKHILTLAFLLAIPAQQTNAEWKFGVAVGKTEIGYELTDVEAGSIDDIGNELSEDTTYVYEPDYSATEFTFDMRNGKHALSYKIADGDVDDLYDERTPAFDATPYTSATNTAEREEWTFSYAYSLTPNWVVSAGIYEGTLENVFTRDYSNTYNAGTIAEYDWVRDIDGTRTTTSEGTFLAIAYQNKITDKLFWFGKLGFQTNDLEIRDQNTFDATLVAVDANQQAAADAFFADQYGMVNSNYAYTPTNVVETDGNSTVFGLGLVYVINPKNTITLEYESKTYSYDPGQGSEVSCVGFSYVCDQDPAPYAAKVDEEASYFTIRYRYAF